MTQMSDPKNPSDGNDPEIIGATSSGASKGQTEEPLSIRPLPGRGPEPLPIRPPVIPPKPLPINNPPVVSSESITVDEHVAAIVGATQAGAILSNAKGVPDVATVESVLALDSIKNQLGASVIAAIESYLKTSAAAQPFPTQYSSQRALLTFYGLLSLLLAHRDPQLSRIPQLLSRLRYQSHQS